MLGQDRGDPVAAGLGDDRVKAAPVGRARDARDQAVAFQPVDDAGHAARGQRGLRGQIGHAQLAVGRAGEPQKHLELDLREVVLGDLAGQTRPSAQIGLAEQTHGGDPGVVEEFLRPWNNYSSS